jgi:hypothetical protein
MLENNVVKLFDAVSYDADNVTVTVTDNYTSSEYTNSIPLNMDYYNDDKYNKLRRCKLIMFSHCLGEKTIFDKSNNTTYTKDYIIKYLEKGCLNRAITKAKEFDIRCIWDNDKFIFIYHSVCYKVACNIDNESSVKSDYILKKILNDDIELIEIAKLNSKQLCPEKYIKTDEKFNKRNNVELKIKYSEMYRCRKCKKNQTTTSRRYARSLDEGVDLTITCCYCNYSWCA